MSLNDALHYVVDSAKRTHEDKHSGEFDNCNYDPCFATSVLKPFLVEKYDSSHNQDEPCACSDKEWPHTYGRHFDWMYDYAPGCKYCGCRKFRPA